MKKKETVASIATTAQGPNTRKQWFPNPLNENRQITTTTATTTSKTTITTTKTTATPTTSAAVQSTSKTAARPTQYQIGRMHLSASATMTTGTAATAAPASTTANGHGSKASSSSHSAHYMDDKKFMIECGLKYTPKYLLTGQRSYHIYDNNNEDIERPQITYNIVVDNSPDPFEPRIQTKPNALVALDLTPLKKGRGGFFSYPHPYEYEINAFQVNDWQLEKCAPILPKRLRDAPYTFVDSNRRLKKLVAELKKEREIAVDLEGHIRRSFLGITCILQISTRTADYILDALVLREKLELLNTVFTDPNILKVFHGSSYDITWMQRDLSLYVVNMFDTYEAAKDLKLDTLSLYSLVKQYYGLDLDKSLQSHADWRIRPLPSNMVCYARQDTHYLLYVYDVLRNLLIDRDEGGTQLLESVYDVSRDICKLKYSKPKMINLTALCHRYQKAFDQVQWRSLQNLFAWRNEVARAADESLEYVLPNHLMFEIAEKLPDDLQGVLDCCFPRTPPLVQEHLHDIMDCILDAHGDYEY